MDRTKIPKHRLRVRRLARPVSRFVCIVVARAAVSGIAVDVTKAVGTRHHEVASIRADSSHHRQFMAFTVAKISPLQCNTTLNTYTALNSSGDSSSAGHQNKRG